MPYTKNIGIIGGGAIGLCTAYYLQQAGHKVTIFDQGDLQHGCSWGNAGMIVPSHIIPLAAPGMISKGIRWMFNSRSPFYVRPRLSGGLLKWGYYFYKHANEQHVEKSIPALKHISLFSKALYQQMASTLPFDFGYHERGLLMLYQTKETEKEETETAYIANKHGIEAQILSAQQVQDLEPDVRVKARGGVYFPGDAHLVPQQFVADLAAYLQLQQAKIHFNTPVTDVTLANGSIKSIRAGETTHEFDEVILAAGSWSGLFSTKLGIDLPMQAGKGYSFTLPDIKKNVRIPSIFLEARVAVTPMDNTLRFGGTMEITGVDPRINMNRVRGIVDSIPNYYPDMQVALPEREKIWYGFRPCSPDGLPYVGRHKALKNLVIATGHSMMGVSLAPGTGKLVAEIVNDEPVSMDIRPFDPARFS